MFTSRVLAAVLILSLFLSPSLSLACGHDGFYAGGGYTQLFMFSAERRLGLTNDKVHFSPGFGLNAVFGYDFCGSRWGVQMPFEFTAQRLNYYEWVYQFGSSAEAVFHIKEWK